MNVSHTLLLLASLLSLSVSKNLQKRSIPYFTPKKLRCDISTMCTTTKALGEMLKKQSKLISNQGSVIEAKFKEIEKTLVGLQEKVVMLSDELAQQVNGWFPFNVDPLLILVRG